MQVRWTPVQGRPTGAARTLAAVGLPTQERAADLAMPGYPRMAEPTLECPRMAARWRTSAMALSRRAGLR